MRLAIAWVADLIGKKIITPNDKTFEAALEVQKLPKSIAEQMAAMKKMEGNARVEAEAQLAHLELQLEQNRLKLELGGGGEAAGFVAAKGLSKAKQKQYAELAAKLRGLEPGTDEHKSVRREMYELIGGDMPYAQWEKVYASNVERANKANESVKAEQSRLGWGETEQTIKIPPDEVRRLDIADTDPKVRKGVEVEAYETGYIAATEDIVWEVDRDAKLVKKGWEITWVLIDTEPSGPLLEKLLAARITVEIRTRKGGGNSKLVIRHSPPAKAGATAAK